MKKNDYLIILVLIAATIIATATVTKPDFLQWNTRGSDLARSASLRLDRPNSRHHATIKRRDSGAICLHEEGKRGCHSHSALGMGRLRCYVGAVIAPAGGSFGQCEDTASSCSHYGLYPQITLDATGLAYVSGNDFSSVGNVMRYHTIRDSALLEGNFGYISDGSIRTSSGVQWPKIDMTEFSGTPVFYQSVTSGGGLAVYRKIGWSESTMMPVGS